MSLIAPDGEHRTPKHLGERRNIDPLWLPAIAVVTAVVLLVAIWSAQFPPSPAIQDAYTAPVIAAAPIYQPTGADSSPVTSTTVAPPPSLAHLMVWPPLADCESGEWDRNGVPIAGSARWDDTRDGYSGGLHFTAQTWTAFRPVSFPPAAAQATVAEQEIVAERVLAAQGWNAWPVCSRKLNLTGGRT